MVRPLRTPGTLATQLAEDLRSRIMSGELPERQRLPSETELASQYGISRVTVRTALRSLEAQGLISTRHGAGSFVADFGSSIRTGLQELRSISETIHELGHTPGMERRAIEVRPATEAESTRLSLSAGEDVVALERRVLADDEPVAFSFDLVPARLVAPEALADFGLTSIFDAFEQAGVWPVRAVAEVHAVRDRTLGWGAGRPESGLYVLLDQVHYDRRGSAVMHSRTYFAEGRFQFVVMRTR